MKVWCVCACGCVGVRVHGTCVYGCTHVPVCVRVCIVLHETFIEDIHLISCDTPLPVFDIYAQIF